MLKLSMRGLAIFILILSGIVPAEAVSGSPEGFETDVQTPNKPWTNLEFKNDPGAFQFAVGIFGFGNGTREKSGYLVDIFLREVHGFLL